jgi:hypothetical protein
MRISMAPTRAQFLDPKDVSETLEEVHHFAAESHTPVALVGGVAMMVYGSDRMTKDVDVASYEGWDLRRHLNTTRDLSIGGFSGLTPKGHRLDVIVRTDDYRDLYTEAVEKAVTTPDLPVPVVTPDYLAVLKMAASRPKDLEDLRCLLRLGVLDLDHVRQIVRKRLGVYAVRELDTFVAEDDWRRSRER